ncbi:murein DD-endopeptidase MepM/ murein hydrolase activator NlpD [Agromyces hippuratus]|uniref:Murein DD-endopeptidase MepM/ murein hydrolase activator NlpD n=1 Tax=Agromyces hippuratus TaxID=286438 RepID=A0A852WWV8_9MICO|nr:M23 family metallopeptidase [Agromyces hippuratus]NYG22832.1 murein DD-endopeptidase MepM/ murein hydrolase activator NlpD [Agromyces hippuratus]
MTPPKHGRRAATSSPARPTPVLRTRRLSAGIRSSLARMGAARTGDVRTGDARNGTASLRPAFAVIAMSFAAAMMVATSVPALAVTATGSEDRASVYAPIEDTIEYAPQSVEVGSEAVMSQLAAEQYDVEAAPPPITSKVASLGSVELIDTNAIVWPVQNPGKRSGGYGPRSAPCSGCSTFHDGVDFTPGNGTPVMSIADGVVVLATENGGGLGVNVEVQHNIGGELITSSYAHMQYGSIAVAVGQQVTAGQQLGLVGTTGQSTGPHLHLEMFGSDGVRFDGVAWLSSRVG